MDNFCFKYAPNEYKWEKKPILDSFSCLSKLEKQTGWGSSETLDTYDFEKLSQLIWESTKVNLSVTTLKRV